MSRDLRPFAIATAGFCAFLNLYSPQALLPELANEFHVGPSSISTLMTAGTLAIAVTAPFTGALADIVGRKRLITAAMFATCVPTLLTIFVTSVPQMVALRFLQGALLPPIFTVAVAYIGDEWPAADVARITGLYVVGTSIGGFFGRFIPGVLADLIGWRAAYGVMTVLTLITAVVVTLTLTREKHFVPSGGLANSLRLMLKHLRDPRLIAIYAVGFGVLFNFISTFTYISFHLAAPPYLFTPTLLGALFLTYLASSPLVPWVGRGIALFGRRRFVLGIIGIWIAGVLMMLASPLTVMLTGLTLCAVCGMLCQAVSTSYVTTIAKEGRSSAVGLYATMFYIGGSAGAFLGGIAWTFGGWGGCVAMILAMQLIIAAIVAIAWK
jgi:MFS transporter, YNFM family, putative membrane transport protein